MSSDSDFAELIRAAWRARDKELRQKFSRSLPLGDALFDRWERAKTLGFADGVSIYNSACVFGSVNVGPNTWIGPNVMLDGSGGNLEIGRSCSISAGVQIYTHDTVLWAVSGGVQSYRKAPVKIGDCCYLGSQSIIAAGVTIGRQCVIGANSFVNDDVPDRSIVTGSTARVVGRVVGDGGEARLDFFPVRKTP
jgi:acetyltransferase-like isoleucine patch superfamily enzyme